MLSCQKGFRGFSLFQVRYDDWLQGDMRQALNNLQSTYEGFGFVKAANVWKVCDEPHPLLIKDMLSHCVKADIDEAYKVQFSEK